MEKISTYNRIVIMACVLADLDGQKPFELIPIRRKRSSTSKVCDLMGMAAVEPLWYTYMSEAMRAIRVSDLMDQRGSESFLDDKVLDRHNDIDFIEGLLIPLDIVVKDAKCGIDMAIRHPVSGPVSSIPESRDISYHVEATRIYDAIVNSSEKYEMLHHLIFENVYTKENICSNTEFFKLLSADRIKK